MNSIFKKIDFKNIFSVIKKHIKDFVKFVSAKSVSSYNFALKNAKALWLKLLNSVFLANIKKFVKNNKFAVRVTAFCLAIIVSLAVTVAVSGAKIGFKVEYNGKVIGTVRNSEITDNAFNLARKALTKSAKSELSDVKLRLTITFRDKLDSANKVASAMLSNTDKIKKASALVVNGEQFIVCETEILSELLTLRKSAYSADVQVKSAEFIDKIETEDGYYLAADVLSREKALEYVNTLSVKTTYLKQTDIIVKYQSKQVKTSLQRTGYRKVTTAGKNGLTKKTEEIVTLNGEVVNTTLISSEIISSPVTEVVTIGTGTTYISASDKANISAAGFICPLASGSYKITSYWGDGRGHKGVDLSAAKGTPIYAAASGTVTFSGWYGGYGYSVVIDHGNGLTTRYAHASALYVTKGQKVNQGQSIAGVGTTGDSTGNHLHFEVMINGTRVNPAPYIGL